MSRFEESTVVDVPVRVAYEQWTRFEDFPEFMEGVEAVTQLDDRTLRWTASVAGMKKEWTAQIVDQTPDRRVAWKSVEGAGNAGAVMFRPIGPDRTEVTLRLEVEPDGPVETAGDALGFIERRVRGDLERFKKHVERETMQQPGWRGEIHGDEVRPDPDKTAPAVLGAASPRER